MRVPHRAVLTAAAVTLSALASAAPAAAKLQLRILGLQHGRFGINQIYDGLGCRGRNLSPAMTISGVPAGTRSLAITMFDPDAPTQSGWWQWLAYNLPAGTRRVAEGAGAAGGHRLPRGARQGINDFSQRAYGGPCPPVGAPAHRYEFILWAEKVRALNVPGNASAALISLMIERYAIAHRVVVVPYGR